MKSFIKILLILAMSIALCIGAIACAKDEPGNQEQDPSMNGSNPDRDNIADKDPDSGVHEHSFVFQNVVDASCNSSGYSVYKCSGCQTIERRNWVDPLGHSFTDYEVLEEPTFFAEGRLVAICDNCNVQDDFKTLPKLTGTLTYTVENDKNVLRVDYGSEGALDKTLMQATELPDNVTVVGTAVPASEVDTLVLGDNIIRVAGYSIPSCLSSVTSLVIGVDMESIGDYAFSGCSSLTVVSFLGDAPQVGDESFNLGSRTYPKLLVSESSDGFDGVTLGGAIILRPTMGANSSQIYAMTLNEYAQASAESSAELAEKIIGLFAHRGETELALLPYEENMAEYKLIKDFALELTKSCRTDRERVDVIYDWIVDNIVYDDGAIRHDPGDVLLTKRAVCAGYVTLMHDMLSAVDVISLYTRGTTLFGNPATVKDIYSDRTEMVSHAWLAIIIGGDILFYDPTWGVSDKEFYRAMSVEDMGRHAVTFEVDSLEVIVDGADFTMYMMEGQPIQFLHTDGYIYCANMGDIVREGSTSDAYNFWFAESFVYNVSGNNIRVDSNIPRYAAHNCGILTGSNLMQSICYSRSDGRTFRLIRVLEFIELQNEYYGKSIEIDSEYTVEYNGMIFNLVGGKLGLVSYVGDATELTVPALVNGIPVKEIAQGAFYGNSTLERVIIENGIEKIWVSAFYNNTALRYVYLPASVRYCCNDIPEGEEYFGRSSIAFERCINLECIEVDSANPELASLDGNLYSKDMRELIVFAPKCGSGTIFTVPATVEHIANNAFAYAELKSVVFTSAVHIGEMAFFLSDLEYVTVPSYVELGRYCFAFAYNLRSVVLEEGHTAIPYSAFNTCNSLVDITIPSTVTAIEDFAFVCCTRLYRLTLPEGVKSIGFCAFSDCPLVTVTLPSTLESIDVDAFLGCHRLFVINNLSSIVLELGSGDNGGIAYYAREIHNGEVDNSNVYLTDNGLVFYNDGEVNLLVEYIGYDATVLILPDTFMGAPYAMVDKVFADFYVSAWDTGDMFDIEHWEYPISHSGSLVHTVVIPTCITVINPYAFAGWGALDYIFYAGDADQWAQVALNINPALDCNIEVRDADIAFYSEIEPQTEGLFWHYVDGVPTRW